MKVCAWLADALVVGHEVHALAEQAGVGSTLIDVGLAVGTC